MYGFPPATDLKSANKSKILPANAICSQAKIALTDYYTDITSCELTHMLSANTLQGINCDGNINVIAVIEIEVKRSNYNRDMVAKIADAMNNSKVIFIVKFEDKCQVLINFENHPIRSDWETNLNFVLKGNTLDLVWENIVKVVGQINQQHGFTLAQQIKINELKAKLDKEIKGLETKCRQERQPNRQRVLFQELRKLKDDYNGKIDALIADFNI